MNFSATTLEGVVICQPQVYRDARGFFAEVFKAEVFAREVTTRFDVGRKTRGACRGAGYLVNPTATL
jgi:dTDP-4-dehydrorhamnose 3,5-epimerase-like enzyme